MKFGHVIILRKKNVFQKIQQKLRTETWFQVFLYLQRIEHNLNWEITFLKQTTYIRYVIAKLLKFVLISVQTSSDSFLQRILCKLERAWK